MEETINSTSRKDKFKFAHRDEIIHDTKFETKPVSYLHDCMRRFVKNKASVVGAIIILLIKSCSTLFSSSLLAKHFILNSKFVSISIKVVSYFPPSKLVPNL